MPHDRQHGFPVDIHTASRNPGNLYSRNNGMTASRKCGLAVIGISWNRE
jgi:hypothetical protein